MNCNALVHMNETGHCPFYRKKKSLLLTLSKRRERDANGYLLSICGSKSLVYLLNY
jgi:hypothetical protein